MTRRIIEINQDIIGTVQPRSCSVRQKKLTDFPTVSAAHRQLAKNLSSPLMFGPPICDELMAVVQHVFTEAEAEVAQHLSGMIGKTAGQLARASHLPVDAVEPILDILATKKRAIAAIGSDHRTKYKLVLPECLWNFDRMSRYMQKYGHVDNSRNILRRNVL